MIAGDKWVWFGNAGHFICARWCQFHLCTKVGRYLVSTVGEYMPDEGSREIYAKSANIVLEGGGDERYADFMKKHGFVEIGYARKYETMVFRAGKPCNGKECGCGLPEIDGRELDTLAANDAKTASRNHRILCKKYAAKSKPKGVDAS